MRHVAFAVAAVVLCTASVSAAADKNGLDPSKIKLPKGPGSLEGVGENAEPNINRGTVSYGVPIELPQGYQGFSPSLRLAYSSSGGASEVGIGWSLGLPSIERMTLRGLPRYDDADTFVANSGDELVRLAGQNVYRARFEGRFVRYRWIDAGGQGRDGYWTAEYPDGRVGYFGADANGTLVPEARTSGTPGTFAYHLVEMVDVYGHSIRYDYVLDGARPLLTHIGWVYAGATPRYEAELLYEARTDELADGKSGFEVVLTQRVANIVVKARGAQRWRYELTYEDMAQSGGLSRLMRVRRFGTDDALAHPVVFDFTYTRGLGAACASASCVAPYLRELGSLGVDFATGTADFVDLNGDGLPDVVDTSSGSHELHINQLAANGAQAFMFPVASTTAGSGSAQLSANRVQLVDLNGDAFTDLVDGANSRVLWNRGTGDWASSGVVTNNLPDFANDANLRFFDYDYDKKPDIIHADIANVFYYRNLGNGTFATTAVDGDAIGWGFAESGLRMADMNGDGMQDAVLVLAGGLVSYKLYLGYGHWGATREMFGLDSGVLPGDVQLVDINGDGLSDAVMVLGTEVRYALNENGTDFGALMTIASADGGSIPERTGSVSVRFADMNGNGSTDVVWINASGLVTYLELFPDRANLLTRITNGVGKVIDLAYGSSVLHMVRDGGPSAWTDRLPMPMLTLDTLQVYDTLSGVVAEQTLAFHDGFYDGVLRQFRGYAAVDVTKAGDATSEAGHDSYVFEVGKSDPYRNGLMLEQHSDSGGRALQSLYNTYDDCAVDDIPGGTSPAVRYICQVQSQQVIKEGQASAAWVTTETETTYDGYGNVTLVGNLGNT
ncbi:MAG: SpvB/TcaC N-terminal domain-containing protein, partial [Myxococcota bacterium]